MDFGFKSIKRMAIHPFALVNGKIATDGGILQNVVQIKNQGVYACPHIRISDEFHNTSVNNANKRVKVDSCTCKEINCTEFTSKNKLKGILH